MTKIHKYTSQPQSQQRSIITKTRPDLTMNRSKQILKMGVLKPQELQEIE